MRFAQISQRTQRRWCHAANAGPICFAQSHKGTKMSCWPRSGFSVHAAPDRNDGRKSGLAAASQLFRAFVALCETKNPDLPSPNEAPGPNNLLCHLRLLCADRTDRVIGTDVS